MCRCLSQGRHKSRPCAKSSGATAGRTYDLRNLPCATHLRNRHQTSCISRATCRAERMAPTSPVPPAGLGRRANVRCAAVCEKRRRNIRNLPPATRDRFTRLTPIKLQSSPHLPCEAGGTETRTRRARWAREGDVRRGRRGRAPGRGLPKCMWLGKGCAPAPIAPRPSVANPAKARARTRTRSTCPAKAPRSC